jgi:hypothetical protein
MKTIQKENEILRVKDDVADEKVGKYSWKYVPRSIWKEQVRDVKQIAKEVASDTKKILNEGAKKKKSKK